MALVTHHLGSILFPRVAYDAVHEKLRPHSTSSTVLWENFAGSWNAVWYRYAAAVEYASSLASSLTIAGDAPVPDERFKQERDLFGLFCNGFSAFESLLYGVFSIGAIVSSNIFPIMSDEDKRKINLSSTLRSLRIYCPGDPIISAIEALSSDQSYADYRDIRNILTHRAAPGRRFNVGTSDINPEPTRWKLNDIIIDKGMPKQMQYNLTRMLSDLIPEIETFVKSRL